VGDGVLDTCNSTSTADYCGLRVRELGVGGTFDAGQGQLKSVWRTEGRDYCLSVVVCLNLLMWSLS